MISNKMPLVSIITPSYNSEKFISQTIKSILVQTYTNWELLITDDCSNDDTIKVIKKFKQQDNRIKLFNLKTNKGAGEARNNSILNANGRFIAFCDSDDLWKKEKLQKQVDFLLKNNLAFTYSSYDVIGEKNRFIKQVLAPSEINYQKMLRNNYVGCLTAIYDSKKLGKHYMPKIRKRQDWVLWLKLIKIIDKTKGQNESLALYRNRSKSISSNKIQLIKFNWNVYHIELGYGKIYSLFLIINFIFYYVKKNIS
tara:strand:- start:2088 stop:2849 length:762 start_codon:yes stop_codon:yes gene_type:complete